MLLLRRLLLLRHEDLSQNVIAVSTRSNCQVAKTQTRSALSISRSPGDAFFVNYNTNFSSSLPFLYQSDDRDDSLGLALIIGESGV